MIKGLGRSNGKLRMGKQKRKKKKKKKKRNFG
jgi:hypothetical protein